MPNRPPTVPKAAPNNRYIAKSNTASHSKTPGLACYAVGSGAETHSNAQWLCQSRISASMNPNTLTDQLSLFLDVLETGSFSAAARRHPLTPSAVARRIDSLESSVGSRLFQRSTHAVVPTPAGLAFAERARRIVSELQLARAEAVSLSHAPEGLIRVDAPAAFGRRHLAPVIADFLNVYPGLDVHLHLIDSFVDMQGAHLGKVDLVLR